MTGTLQSRWHNLPWLLCVVCAALPFFAVQATYLISAGHGLVDWCFPYTDSCTSISATGRHPPASYLFRGVMLPSAALMAVFWWVHWHWLQHVAAPRRQRHSMLALGLMACFGLTIYVSVLGEAGDGWRLQRRIGSILFFSFTFLAQLLLAGMLRSSHDSGVALTTGGRLLRLCQIMLLLGIFSVLLQLASEDWHDRIEDALEWQLALLLQLNFLFCAPLWARGPWTLVFQREPRASDAPDAGTAHSTMNRGTPFY